MRSEGLYFSSSTINRSNFQYWGLLAVIKGVMYTLDKCTVHIYKAGVFFTPGRKVFLSTCWKKAAGTQKRAHAMCFTRTPPRQPAHQGNFQPSQRATSWRDTSWRGGEALWLQRRQCRLSCFQHLLLSLAAAWFDFLSLLASARQQMEKKKETPRIQYLSSHPSPQIRHCQRLKIMKCS